jgi:molybdopterin-guanine dinucleotide biosynthesis protein B
MSGAGTPRAIGFFGDSGSGKTTLIERLIERFARAGLRVAAVKHAHHGFDIDRPGKDSYRFRAAGAAQVLLASDQRWALLSEESNEGRGNGRDSGALARQLARFDPCDLVLVEGYRGQAGIPFIRVERKQADRARSTDDAPREAVQGQVIALVTDWNLPGAVAGGIPVLDLNDIEAVARFIAAQLRVPFC